MFMPSIEGGGVEKNFFIVANYLSKFEKVTVISISKNFKSKFNKKIKFVTLKSNFWDNLSRRKKYILGFFLLIKEFFLEKDKIVFSFQANIYAILICKIFFVKIITRSNSAPFGWSNNIIKRKIFKIILKFADKIMVNSLEFKKDLNSEFSVESTCIYNPLNKKEILKKSKVKSRKIFKKSKFKIINVGRFVDQKDQLTLLKALNILKKEINFHAIFVGRGKLKFELLDYIKKNKLKNKVSIINFTKNPFPLIKQSDIFILSSNYEGLPNVLLEAAVLKKFIFNFK